MSCGEHSEEMFFYLLHRNNLFAFLLSLKYRDKTKLNFPFGIFFVNHVLFFWEGTNQRHSVRNKPTSV